ncbi:MAG TPA: DUF4861 family protein [Cyclobacteriaceae bacterium]|nr:DUF4861 family protein [Cyclobacteriaceae bacterium]
MTKLWAMLIVVFLCGCRPVSQPVYSFAFSLEVYNPLSISRHNVLIRVSPHDMGEMYPGFEKLNATGVRVVDREAEIASEYANGNFFVTLDSMRAKEKRTLTVYYHTGELAVSNYTKRTQSRLLKQGPALESDRVGYRITDQGDVGVLGKKTKDMVLMGMDNDQPDPNTVRVLDNGKSFGLFGVASTDSTEVSMMDGLLCSWMASNSKSVTYAYSINADSRWAECEMFFREGNSRLATSILKNPAARFFTSPGTDSSYAYIAAYGRQSLINDNLGLAIAFDPKLLINSREDAYNYIVELREHPGLDFVSWHFAAAWEQEPNGIKTEAEFIKYLDNSARELANPVRYSIKAPK